MIPLKNILYASAFLNKFKYTSLTGPKVHDFVEVSLKKCNNWNFTLLSNRYLNIDEIHRYVSANECEYYRSLKP